MKDTHVIERTNILNNKKTIEYHNQYGNINYLSGTSKFMGYRIEWTNNGSRNQEIRISIKQHLTGNSIGYIRFDTLIDTSNNGTTTPGLFYELEKFTKQIINITNLTYTISRFSGTGIEINITWDCTNTTNASITMDTVYPSELGLLTITEIANNNS